MPLRMRAAWAQIPGTREYQEDHAMITCWPDGYHLLLLGDGIGGHHGGREASRIVVQTMRDHFAAGAALEASGQPRMDDLHPLTSALQASNTALYRTMVVDPALEGMGSTVVAATFDGSGLQWLSVGDSPLYLFRAGRLRRLNSNHSMAAVLSAQVAAGQLSEEQAAQAPERHELLAAVMGQDIALLDEPGPPLPLKQDDLVVVASDGVEVLGSDGITAVLGAHRDDSPERIVDALLTAVESLGRDSQDNTTVMVARLDDDTLETAA